AFVSGTFEILYREQTCREQVERLSHVKVAETLVLRVLLTLTIVIYISPPSTVIPWQVVFMAFVRTGNPACTIYLKLIALLVSALSLKIGVDGSTLSAARRELIGLLQLPSFAFLYQVSTFSNTIPSSSVHHRLMAGQVTAVEPNTFDSLIESHSSTFKAGCKNYERNRGGKPPAHFDK
ncbi:hypothetical protein N7539_008607, partial [Penicillium diatomitis]